MPLLAATICGVLSGSVGFCRAAPTRFLHRAWAHSPKAIADDSRTRDYGRSAMPCLLHLDQRPDKRPDKRPNQCAANFRTRAARSAACPGRNHAACSGLTQQARHAIARLWHVRMYMHADGRQRFIYDSRSYVLSARLARRAAQALGFGQSNDRIHTASQPRAPFHQAPLQRQRCARHPGLARKRRHYGAACSERANTRSHTPCPKRMPRCSNLVNGR